MYFAFTGFTSFTVSAAASVIAALAALVARDAYRGRERPWPRTAAFDALAGAVSAFAAQGLVTAAVPAWIALPGVPF